MYVCNESKLHVKNEFSWVCYCKWTLIAIQYLPECFTKPGKGYIFKLFISLQKCKCFIFCLLSTSQSKLQRMIKKMVMAWNVSNEHKWKVSIVSNTLNRPNAASLQLGISNFLNWLGFMSHIKSTPQMSPRWFLWLIHCWQNSYKKRIMIK